MSAAQAFEERRGEERRSIRRSRSGRRRNTTHGARPPLSGDFEGGGGGVGWSVGEWESGGFPGAILLEERRGEGGRGARAWLRADMSAKR